MRDKTSEHEESLGNETVDGHPAKKVKVTTSWTDKNGKQTTYVETVWRATDLNDIVIRSVSADGKRETHLEKIVMGKPDAKLTAFPAPPCDAGEMSAIGAAKPQ